MKQTTDEEGDGQNAQMQKGEDTPTLGQSQLSRLQRWALLLSAYSYEIEWKPTREHAKADGLSRSSLYSGKPPVAGS